MEAATLFLGHFAVGLAAKRRAPRVSLGLLFLACQLADLVWPLFVLTGIERVEVSPGKTAFNPLDFVHYPWSHSLLMALLWGAALAAFYRIATKDRVGALWLGLVVVSHWVLDWITHAPDMPILAAGGPRVGLGLWNHAAATVIVEGAMLVGGLVIYTRTTRARDRVGSIALWSLVAFLVLVYGASSFGPPPPDGRTVAISALALWLLVPWGIWIDRHRGVR